MIFSTRSVSKGLHIHVTKRKQGMSRTSQKHCKSTFLAYASGCDKTQMRNFKTDSSGCDFKLDLVRGLLIFRDHRRGRILAYPLQILSPEEIVDGTYTRDNEG